MRDLTDKFFQDPDWKEVENIILEYINPLLEMDSVDTNQPAEHVKAEIIGRKLAYNCLIDFLNENKLVTRDVKKVKNPFQ